MTERDHILAALAVSRQWMSAARIIAATQGRVSPEVVGPTLERLAFEYLVDRQGDSYKISDAGLRADAQRRNPADAKMGQLRAIPTTVWGAMSFAAVLAWEGLQDWWMNTKRKGE